MVLYYRKVKRNEVGQDLTIVDKHNLLSGIIAVSIREVGWYEPKVP